MAYGVNALPPDEEPLDPVEAPLPEPEPEFAEEEPMLELLKLLVLSECVMMQLKSGSVY
jgi:hypothetical protein